MSEYSTESFIVKKEEDLPSNIKDEMKNFCLALGDLHKNIDSETEKIKECIFDIIKFTIDKINQPLIEIGEFEKLTQVMSKIYPMIREQSEIIFSKRKYINKLKDILLNGEDTNEDKLQKAQRIYYSRSKSRNRPYSSICYKDIFTKEEIPVRQCNRFSNTCISCKISDESTFLYLGKRGTKSYLLSINDMIESEGFKTTEIKSSTFDHYNSAFAVIDSKVYFFGGNGDKCEMLDCDLKKWFQLPDLPQIIQNPTCCAFGDSIFIVNESNSFVIEYVVPERTYKCSFYEHLNEKTYKVIFIWNNELIVHQDSVQLRLNIQDHIAEVIHEDLQSLGNKKIKSTPIYFNKSIHFLSQLRTIIKLDLI